MPEWKHARRPVAVESVAHKKGHKKPVAVVCQTRDERGTVDGEGGGGGKKLTEPVHP